MLPQKKVYKVYAGFFFSDSRFNWKTESPSWLFLKNQFTNYWPQDVESEYYYEFEQKKQYLKMSNSGDGELVRLRYDSYFTSGHPAGCAPNDLVKEAGLKTKIYFNFHFYDSLPNFHLRFTYQCNNSGTIEEKVYRHTLDNPDFVTVATDNNQLDRPFDRWKSYQNMKGCTYYRFSLDQGYTIGGYNCASGKLKDKSFAMKNPVNFNSAIYNGLRNGAKLQNFSDIDFPNFSNLGTTNNEYSWQETGPRYFYVIVNYEPPGVIASTKGI